MRATISVQKLRAVCIGFLTLLAISQLTGCTINYYYTPGVYEIAGERIPPFERVGTIDVRVVQEPDPSRQYVIYSKRGERFFTDRAMVAEMLAKELAREITHRGGQVTTPAEHTIEIAVPHVRWEALAGLGILSVKLGLSEAETRMFEIRNKSVGNMWRVMNGAIAVAVIDILNDPAVRAWLASTASGSGSLE